MKKLIFYWLPPALWMIIIFTLSSRQSIGVSEEFIINFVVFKTLHVIEYAFLYFLFFRAFNSHLVKNTYKAFLLAAVATVLFAISDELHQTYVPSREGSPRDIAIDTIGIAVCFMYTKNNLKKLRLFL
ncbi:MAG: VanZ-like protein [Candidatus Roizmanbacteria bacterium GW2011_GWA2_37_7]|uniref:VanZ-like protein n=1 Tax=Candidatus Roizmanbacteria bacterium GW2011_GWA2_37_7 TaxID=1618481 RepID=A0A0G0HJG3_9BACT|nr:MAG: VanZ-like protein [Candidatus Roizmanbacteria bacterium GW2011_GWA2_37_7]